MEVVRNSKLFNIIFAHLTRTPDTAARWAGGEAEAGLDMVASRVRVRIILRG